MSKNSRELIFVASKILNEINIETRHINKQIRSLQRKAKNEAPVNEREIFLNGCNVAKQGVKSIQREVLKLRFKKPELETIGQLHLMKDEIIRQRVAINLIYKDIIE